MEKSIVATGKTIDAAIEAALNQLGLDRDSVTVQVLAQAKAGFLGFGRSDAKVQVTYEVPDPNPEEVRKEAPKAALSAACRSKPKVTAPVKREEPAREVKKEQPREAKKEAPKETKKEAPKETARTPKQPREPKEPKEPKQPRVFTPAAPGSVEEKIEVFLKGLAEHMGSDAVPHAWKVDDTTYQVELTGQDLGYLIGHRGDTLDAMQHLVNYAVGRNVEGHIRINVDAEDYRRKREEGLSRYARKKAQQVLKARRRTTLEPMNAYERHVIHATLQDMENITTHSTGTEPNRRVVIEYIK